MYQDIGCYIVYMLLGQTSQYCYNGSRILSQLYSSRLVCSIAVCVCRRYSNYPPHRLPGSSVLKRKTCRGRLEHCLAGKLYVLALPALAGMSKAERRDNPANPDFKSFPLLTTAPNHRRRFMSNVALQQRTTLLLLRHMKPIKSSIQFNCVGHYSSIKSAISCILRKKFLFRKRLNWTGINGCFFFTILTRPSVTVSLTTHQSHLLVCCNYNMCEMS